MTKPFKHRCAKSLEKPESDPPARAYWELALALRAAAGAVSLSLAAYQQKQTLTHRWFWKHCYENGHQDGRMDIHPAAASSRRLR